MGNFSHHAGKLLNWQSENPARLVREQSWLECMRFCVEVENFQTFHITPNNCAVYGCNNLKNKTHGIIYFSFPKDNKIRKKWLHSCHRSDYINTSNAVICSEHFSDDDYEDDLKARLLNIPRKKLKYNAVPSVGLYKEVSP